LHPRQYEGLLSLYPQLKYQQETRRMFTTTEYEEMRKKQAADMSQASAGSLRGLAPAPVEAPQMGVPINTYDFAKSVAAAIVDRLVVKVDLSGHREFAEQVASQTATYVLECIRNNAAEEKRQVIIAAQKVADAKRKKAKARAR
jgi:hypothetical protein